MGVIFCVLLAALAYVVLADPFDIRPMLSAETPAEESDAHPYLSPTQQRTLRAVGVDPAAVPSEITPEMEECFTHALGEERVAEIVAGSPVSPVDVYRARHCVM